ncbi:MAG: hypothetical protein ACTHJQ_12180 [Rhizobiaceae bacterium]
MSKLIAACTTLAPFYPGYLNFSRDDDGSVVLIARGDPEVAEDRSYICGFARDKGQPGRCTPGDENCNNYCNMAPQKGRMQDHPKPCSQTFEGKTVSVRLTADEWTQFLAEIMERA